MSHGKGAYNGDGILKIVHVAESLPGGPASYLNELIRHQVRAYDRVTIICPEGQTDLIENDAVHLVTFKKTGRNPSSLFSLYRTIGQELRRTDYDILHLHSSFAGLAGRLHLSSGSTQIVYCPHGWSHAMKTSNMKKFLFRFVEKLLSFNTRLIINISGSEKALSQRARIPARKCVTIYNGVQNLPWAPLPEDHRLKRLLFVGRYDLQKGIDLLASAMKTLGSQGYELITVGGSVVGEPMIAGFPPSVTNLGWRRPSEVRTLMNEADAIIMPSRWEGFSLVTLEAMRAGRPLIATRVSSQAEAILDEKTGILCKPESPEALIHAVDRLAKMDIRTLGINARRRFEDFYTSERMFRETDTAYSRIIRKSTERPVSIPQTGLS